MEGVIRYRPRWRQLVPHALPLVVGIGLNVWGAYRSEFVLRVLLFAAALPIAARGGTGVDVGPDALLLLGLRRRVVPWPRIGAITVTTMLGTRCITVHADGRSWMLRAPTHLRWLAPDPEFEAKLATICQTWEQRRGPQWRPPMWQAPMVQPAT